jgi:hypothetical protein
MPYDGSGVYSRLVGTTAIPNTIISSDKFNSVIDDIVAAQNYARPVRSGGTGAADAAGARANLDAQIDVTKTDRLVIGSSISGAKDTFLDFHSGLTGVFSARIIRSSGNNGTLQVAQTGTGAISIGSGTGGFLFSAGGGPFTYNGGNIWTDSLVAVGTGWRRDPGNLLIQRGTVGVTTNANGDATVNLPTAFTSASAYHVLFGLGDPSVAAVLTAVGSKTASTFSVRATYLNNTPVVGTISITFIAIGV